MPNKKKGPSRDNYLRESIVAILAVFIAKADSIVIDAILVTIIGYLLVEDYRDRHRSR
ncbi:hypothetical protein [Bifidobacterium sp. ESL0790]|uniref:hypothetical protein n=1 Tax=Bifidobacterium sp. ESL0790 TaxID=2983233 RepID=UPI0023F6261A|nr:hypothetical protein [Bifidobacterium sp. ESL0790]WEV72530.1 hypothetical protein OZY47_00630 [Bifidobacterium sp. ESL0790]